MELFYLFQGFVAIVVAVVVAAALMFSGAFVSWQVLAAH